MHAGMRIRAGGASGLHRFGLRGRIEGKKIRKCSKIYLQNPLSLFRIVFSQDRLKKLSFIFLVVIIIRAPFIPNLP